MRVSRLRYYFGSGRVLSRDRWRTKLSAGFSVAKFSVAASLKIRCVTSGDFRECRKVRRYVRTRALSPVPLAAKRVACRYRYRECRAVYRAIVAVRWSMRRASDANLTLGWRSGCFVIWVFHDLSVSRLECSVMCSVMCRGCATPPPP